MMLGKMQLQAAAADAQIERQTCFEAVLELNETARLLADYTGGFPTAPVSAPAPPPENVP